MKPEIVSREKWLEARAALLAEERALTHASDALKRKRRALPWRPVEDYVFDAPGGEARLSDLFEGRSQLLVQHFMLAPGKDHICPGCAGMADGVDGARAHFEAADLSFAAVSRASTAEIEATKARMGWRFTWVSSGRNAFNYDFGVSFTPEQVEAKTCGDNFGATAYASEDLPGVSVFAKDQSGALFHTYSAYARGVETVVSPFNYLDFAPKGRNETGGTMSWLRLRDEYGAAEPACCAGTR